MRRNKCCNADSIFQYINIYELSSFCSTPQGKPKNKVVKNGQIKLFSIQKISHEKKYGIKCSPLIHFVVYRWTVENIELFRSYIFTAPLPYFILITSTSTCLKQENRCACWILRVYAELTTFTRVVKVF